MPKFCKSNFMFMMWALTIVTVITLATPSLATAQQRGQQPAPAPPAPPAQQMPGMNMPAGATGGNAANPEGAPADSTDPQAMLDRIHEKLAEQLAREGARLDALLACTDHPEQPSRRRKPAPGMLEEAIRRFRAIARETPMIGDNLRDLEAAAAIGCPRHLVRTGHGASVQAAGLPAAVLPVRVHENLGAAVDVLLAES